MTKSSILNGNGRIKLWKTHPTLYRMLMLFTIIYFLQGLNFLLLHPTFKVYHAPDWVWGSIFLSNAVCNVLFIHVYRNLWLVRMMQAISLFYIFGIALGNTEPWIVYLRNGEKPASLQLPIWVIGAAAAQAWMLLEPYINPQTKKDD